MTNFSNVNLEIIKDPKKFPPVITNNFHSALIKEIRHYKPNKYTILFKNGKSGYLVDYGPSSPLRRQIKTVMTVEEGSVKKGLQLLDAAAERRKKPSQDSYQYNKFIKEFNSRMRGQGVKKRLSYGVKGEAVSNLQTILNSYSKAFSVQPLKIDGIFGNKTSNFVKWFQFFTGCKIDGIVGVETWRTIEQYEKK